jgi:cardiolipin synthase
VAIIFIKQRRQVLLSGLEFIILVLDMVKLLMLTEKNAKYFLTKLVKRKLWGAIYKNAKNLISIDGVKTYIYSAYSYKSKEKPISCSTLYYKLQGEVVKSIDLDAHIDVSFATQKYFELTNKQYTSMGNIQMQYVSSVVDKDFEGLLLKAINDAKKQIIIHINKFIPTPAVKQALSMAIMSGVDVKIMLSKGRSMSYYASRAYLKEMAMIGATAYIYDGVIGSNFVIIDDLTFVGNFSLVNLEIRNNLQNALIINDKQFSNQTQLYFNELVNNSYRICKPKNVLFREKIFKKFN